MFSEKLFVLFSAQFCHQKKSFFLHTVAFNLTMHQYIHWSEKFTHLIFSTNLGGFEKT